MQPAHHEKTAIDFGTGQKKLGIYLIGMIGCSILTLVAFWTVMSGHFSKLDMFSIIFIAAFFQFLLQLICFLRLNLQTEAARTNVMSLVFTIVILGSILIGSLWIMSNLDYNMVH